MSRLGVRVTSLGPCKVALLFEYFIEKQSLLFNLPILQQFQLIALSQQIYGEIACEERDKKVSTLFIAGNGFDLAHGLPTLYSSFRKYIIDMYPYVEEFKTERLTLDGIFEDEEMIGAISAELLIYAMDQACGPEWKDFENALGSINFYDKLPGPTPEALDDTDEEKHNREMGYYLEAVGVLSSLIVAAAELWEDFFNCWIYEIEAEIESGAVNPKESLIKLFSSPDTYYMTFNYTKTLQKIYGIRGVRHIHNRVGQKLIFGHGKGNASYDEPFDELSDMRTPLKISTLDDLLNSFKKDTSKQMKKYSDFFKRLDSNIDKVYSYGFSYSAVDSVYIKTIIKQISQNAVWFFTEHEASDKEGLRIKKIKLRRYGFRGDFGIYEG